MALAPRLSKYMSLSFGGDTIGYANDFELSIDKTIIDVTTLSADGWKEFMADMKEWKVSVNGLVTYGTPGASEIGSEALIDSLIDSDAELTLIFTSGETDDQYVTGSAILMSYKQGTTVNDKQTFSAEFQGTGALTNPTVT